MFQKSQRSSSGFRTLGIFFFFILAFACPALSQDRSTDLGGLRGNRAQVSITIKEGSSQLIGPLVTVKLYYRGALANQISTTKGRTVFLLNGLGDFTITADAVGYRSAQKEISVPVAVEAEEEIILQRDSNPEALGASGRPLLAPKAQEAMEKALNALNENKLDQAEKDISEAATLAPNNPDVLYTHGVIFLRRGQAQQAQTVLEKTTQIDPQNARAFTALGMAFMGENKYDLANAPLQQSIQLDPANWEAHWTLARVLYRQEKYDTCLTEAQQALSQAHGSQPEVELLIAQAQVAVEKFEQAADTLRSFLRLHPDDKGAATARKWLDRLAADGKIRKQ